MNFLIRTFFFFPICLLVLSSCGESPITDAGSDDVSTSAGVVDREEIGGSGQGNIESVQLSEATPLTLAAALPSIPGQGNPFASAGQATTEENSNLLPSGEGSPTEASSSEESPEAEQAEEAPTGRRRA